MLFALLYGCAPSPRQKDTLVLINGLLMNGSGSDPIPNADVLIVSSDPLDDVQNLFTIQMVIHHGQVIHDDSQNP
jgi:hypothetical protein